MTDGFRIQDFSPCASKIDRVLTTDGRRKVVKANRLWALLDGYNRRNVIEMLQSKRKLYCADSYPRRPCIMLQNEAGILPAEAFKHRKVRNTSSVIIPEDRSLIKILKTLVRLDRALIFQYIDLSVHDSIAGVAEYKVIIEAFSI